MDEFTSKKFRFYSFLSMVLLVFVHGYNLNDRYLLAFSVVHEQLTFNTFTQYFLANGILRFRIPMLFIISGYLFAMRDEKPYGERVRKRLRTLLVPYILWSVLGLIVTYLFELHPLTRNAVVQASLQPFSETRIADYSLPQLFFRIIMAPVPFQLWFIRVLLVYNIAYPWLKAAVTKFPAIFFSFAVLLWMSTISFWFLEGEGLLFFSLGIWLSKNSFDIRTPPRWIKPMPLMIFWMALAAIKTWLAFQPHFGYPVLFPVLIMLHKAVVAIGLFAVWFGADALVRFFMNQKWFLWVSAFSFIIYALHVPLINYLITLVFPCLDSIPNFRLMLFIVLPVSVIALSVGLGFLLRSSVPRFYSLLTGGRGLS